MTSEKIIVGEGTEYPLNGLLTLPDAPAEKLPGVVLVHGSGASDMDERIYKLTPFRDLAEGLAARGIASVRYDKRTFAHAKKMLGQCVTAWEETIGDALRAAELLRRDPRVDPASVYLLGHSLGAMLAPRIDAEGGRFRGLILMAGSPFRLEEIVVRQLRQTGGRGGLMGAVVRLEDRIFSKKFDGLYEMPDAEAKKKKFAGSTTLYYFKEMGRKTAADYLLESDTPALLLQGGMDFQVLAAEDFARFRELLKDRGGVEYRLYDGLNHLFVKGLYNDILKAGKEYKVEQHIGGEVMDDIAAFIRHTRAAGGEQLGRIARYEATLGGLEALLAAPERSAEALAAFREKADALEAYYTGPEWKRDFADDEAGLLPEGLKRGVLSEDGVWNALEEYRALLAAAEDGR